MTEKEQNAGAGTGEEDKASTGGQSRHFCKGRDKGEG